MDEIQEMHLSLQQQLDQLEAEHHQIGEGILETQRRIGILDEAMSWSPVEVEPYQELPLEDAFQTADAEDTEIQWVNR